MDLSATMDGLRTKIDVSDYFVGDAHCDGEATASRDGVYVLVSLPPTAGIGRSRMLSLGLTRGRGLTWDEIESDPFRASMGYDVQRYVRFVAEGLARELINSQLASKPAGVTYCNGEY